MKEIVRSYIWMPGLDKDLEQAAKTCVSCLKQKRNPQKNRINTME